MKRGLTGHYIPLPSGAGEQARAFVPNPLPPVPPLDLHPEIQELIQNAMLALGRLDGLTTVLPDPAIFLYSYVRKEAVLSSQIEGTQSSLSDLLLFEMEGVTGVPLNDVQEVSNYVAAMHYGLKRLEKLPLSLRLLKEIHGVLLAKGRGSKKEPGEFRRSQNWVGGTRPGNALFVPPPPDQVLECLGALEKFLHNDPVKTPLLIKAALAHVQFETIHPFLDGNGRLGRLLITFLFCAEGTLREPLLYLSLYFKQHRQQYYDLLQSVRLTGDWEAWLCFFLIGVEETANQAGQTAKALMKLAATDEKRIQTIGKASGSALRVHRLLQAQPILSIASAGKELNLTVPTVTLALKHLAKLSIARETTGRNYGRIYAYDKYLKILNEGTEPLREIESSESVEDEEARKAVEWALAHAEWDYKTKTISLYNPDDDRIRSTVKNRDELESYLRGVAETAFYAYASRDDGEFLSTCHADDYVQAALEAEEDRLEKFFTPETEPLD